MTTLKTKALTEYSGKEAVVVTADYPPGEAMHRHNSHAFVYVFEGSIVMGLRCGESVTLTPGQTF